MTQRRKGIALYLFLGPCLIYILVFRIAPVFYTAYLSFTSWHLAIDPSPVFVGLENYRNLAVDSRFRYSLLFTFVFTTVAVAVQLLLGLAFALLIDRRFRGKNAVQGLLLVPMFMTPAVVGTLWYILFHDSIGPINWVFRSLGIPTVPWLSRAMPAFASIVIADVWQWTPFMFLLIFSALQTVPVELYEAGRIDGASSIQLFHRITLPFILPVMGVAVLLRSMDAFREFDKVFVLTGGGPGQATETVSVLIYKAAFSFFDMGYASAMVLVVFAVLSIGGAAYMRRIRFES